MSPIYHFISGLPRSGSTLLSALLLQNPRFQAGMSSPLGALYGVVSGNLSGSNELYSLISDEHRRRILTGLFDSFYADSAKDVVFDTSRYWTSKMAALNSLFPSAKVICCVRPIEEILNSVERLLENSPLEASGLFGFRTDGNVITRAEFLRSPKGMVGSSLSNLKQACFGRFGRNILLIQYSSLTNKPVETLKSIYEFIGEEYFEHDPETFSYDAHEVDIKLGAKGLHRVVGPVRPGKTENFLPPEVIRGCQNLNFWTFPGLLDGKVTVI